MHTEIFPHPKKATSSFTFQPNLKVCDKSKSLFQHLFKQVIKHRATFGPNQINKISDSQSVARSPAVGHGGTANGLHEVITINTDNNRKI